MRFIPLILLVIVSYFSAVEKSLIGISKSLDPKLKGKHTPRNSPSSFKPIINVLKKLDFPKVADRMFNLLPGNGSLRA